jgi:uncharacterized membrane protein
VKFNWKLLVFYFLVFAVAGWLYEMAHFWVYNWRPIYNRGFLYGLYLPVYGFGGVLLVLTLSKLMRKKIKVWRLPITPLLVFLGICFIVTVVELITGVALLELFGRRWWDYSYTPLNFMGHISVRHTLRFGVGGMIMMYLVNPPLEKLFRKIPDKGQLIFAITALTVLIADLVLVIIFRI